MAENIPWGALWEVLKTLVLPIVGFFWYYIVGRLNHSEEEIRELQEAIEAVEKDNIQTKAEYATKAELNAMVVEFNKTLQESNINLELRLEKIIDLKNESIKSMLQQLVDKK